MLKFSDFGVEEVKDVAGHFKTTLQRSEFEDEDVLNEWRMLKIVLHKRYIYFLNLCQQSLFSSTCISIHT